MGTQTVSTSHWVDVDNSSMGTHTGPTPHWAQVEVAKLTIALCDMNNGSQLDRTQGEVIHLD